MKIQRAMISGAWSSGRTTVLLRAIDPVRKSIVGDHVIKLAGGLVVPGTPRSAGVARDDCALIAAHDHALRLFRIDPQLVIVVAARRAFPGGERCSTVDGLVRGSIRNVNDVGIFWIDAEFAEIPAALPEPAIVRNALPICCAIVRAIQAAVCRV